MQSFVTPCASACATSDCQYGMTDSSHCYASTSAASGGHTTVIQFAQLSPGPPGSRT